MGFLPDNYEAPKGGGGEHYFKPLQGKSRVRVLSKNCVLGYVGWDRSGDKPKPERAKTRDAVAHLHSADDKVKHFWAMLVLDRADGMVKIWEVTQASIQQAIGDLAKDREWGHPYHYDLIINKAGQKLDTTYSIMPAIKTPIDLNEQQLNAARGIQIERLFDGGDPFEGVKQTPQAPEEFVAEINSDDTDDSIPF